MTEDIKNLISKLETEQCELLTRMENLDESQKKDYEILAYRTAYRASAGSINIIIGELIEILKKHEK